MSIAADERLASKQTAFHEIPIIDVASLLDGSDPQAVADQIGQVCAEVGFFYVKNHGVPTELVERMYRATEWFFDLPYDQKQQLNIENSGPTLRGYVPTFGENVDPENTRDYKESFDFGAHDDNVSPFFGPNQMPKDHPEFEKVSQEYHDAMLGLARHLVRGMSLSLGLPADAIEQKQQKPITIQRLLHYPSQDKTASQEEIGIGAHTDYGFLTILSQDDVGGLQVRNREGDWISAPPVEGTFVINIGDLAQTLTNDRYSSTLHRVVNTSGKERYSIPFFMDLDYDAVVEPLDVCVSEENPAKYEPYVGGEHKYSRYVDSYAHLQQ